MALINPCGWIAYAGDGDGKDDGEGKGKRAGEDSGDGADEGEGGEGRTSAASASSSGANSGGAFLSSKRRHGVLAVVGWGVLVPAGVALARFFKHLDPFWYHHNVGRAAVALCVANIFYGLSLANERQEWSYVYGIFVGIFAVVFLVLDEWRRRH